MILCLTGVGNAQENKTTRGMNETKVAGGHEWGACPKGNVTINFVSPVEIGKMQREFCDLNPGNKKWCGGKILAFYLPGIQKIYAVTADEAIHEMKHYCGWRHDIHT